MYSFQGCYSLNNDISINNIFTTHQKNSSSVGDCERIASINNSPFFALTGGNINKATCLLGTDVSVNNNITLLSNYKNKVKIQDICNSDLSNRPNLCGYNNPNKKTDIYSGDNNYSLYTSANSMLLFKNQGLLSKTYESPFYFKNKLEQLDNDFKRIIGNLKNSYIEFIRSKSESQVFNDIIADPKIVIIKKENIFQILTDLLRLFNNYNILINEIVKNSKVVFEKLNVFRSSTGLLENEIFNNKEVLNELLNNNRADNGQLLSNNLKKGVLISKNIILIIVLIFLFIFKKK